MSRPYIKDLQILYTEEEFLKASIELLDQCSRYVRIRSSMLDPTLFDTPEFNEALSRFARRSRYSEVHILLDMPDILLKRGHRTLELMRKLSQKITIKQFYEEPDEYRPSTITTDSTGILIKYPEQDAEGYFSLTDNIYTKQEVDRFDSDWSKSQHARQLRQLHI